MDLRTVSIERTDFTNSSLYRQTGTMLNQKYIITTSNILLPYFGDNFLEHYEHIQPGTLYTSLPSTQGTLKAVWKNPKESTKYVVRDADILGVFTNFSLKTTCGNILQEWTFDCAENHGDISKLLSIFFVLKLQDVTCSEKDFIELLHQLWDEIKCEQLFQGDELLIKSTPFGSRTFLDSCSKGIVSNIVGDKFCLIVSDCPATPGSEGGSVFKMGGSGRNIFIGLVLSACCWWRKDWTGLTLIVDFRSILMELMGIEANLIGTTDRNNLNHRLIGTIESSLLQVYSGPKWGTAILIDKEEGICITNAHVLQPDDNEVVLFWKGHTFKASVIYRATKDTELDLAILILDPIFSKSTKLNAISVNDGLLTLGDEVYISGHAVFSKHVKSTPMLTRGNIAQFDEMLIKTTCCVNPGMSGGAILNTSGQLVGVVVCNVKLEEDGAVFPRYNMGIPYSCIKKVLSQQIETKSSDDKTIERNNCHINKNRLLKPCSKL